MFTINLYILKNMLPKIVIKNFVQACGEDVAKMMQSCQPDWLEKKRVLFSLDEEREKERENIEKQIKILEECLAEINQMKT